MSQHCPLVLVENPWFFRRYRFHAQKLVLHRAPIRRYSDFLLAEQYIVTFLEAAALDSSSELFIQLAREGFL